MNPPSLFSLYSRFDLLPERLGPGAPCDLPNDRTIDTIAAFRPSLRSATAFEFGRARCSLLPDPATITSEASWRRMETP